MDIHVADSSISDTEKEDREVTRLLDRGKRAPSRKRKEKKAPKHDNRRNRMKVEDPDLDDSDRDMSLNYKYALEPMILASLIFSYEEDSGIISESIEDKAVKSIKKFIETLHEYSKTLSDDFKKWAIEHYLHSDIKSRDIIKRISDRYKILNEYSNKKYPKSIDGVLGFLKEYWPKNNENTWEIKAGILKSLQNTIRSFSVPSSLKLSVISDSGKNDIDPSLFSEMMNELSVNKVSSYDDMALFSAVSNVYKYLLNNINSVDFSKIDESMNEGAAEVYDQFTKLNIVAEYIYDFSKDSSKDEYEDPESWLNGVEQRLNDLMKIKDPILSKNNMKKGIKEYVKTLKLPESVSSELLKRTASNEKIVDNNMKKSTISSYHGVKIQHHPESDSFGKMTILKRDIGKEDYDSIVSTAKEMLSKDPWFKTGWDDGSEDAPFRAALDLTISSSFGSDYQSKIDAPTYDFLLSKLMSKKDDLFSETFVSRDRSGRRASSMGNKNVVQIVKIANQIQKTHPVESFALLRAAHGLESSLTDGVRTSSTNKLNPASLNIKDALKQIDNFKRASDSMSVVEAFGKLSEMFKLSSSRVAADLTGTLESLEDMTDEEIRQFVNEEKSEVTTLETILKDIENKSKGDLSKITDEDIDMLVKGFDDFMDSVEDNVGKAKTSSISVSIPTLLKVASTSSDAKNLLLPVLVAAKKKMTKKKKPSKTSMKKKEEEEEKPKPSSKKKDMDKGSKKEPKSSKKMKSRKSSITVTASDLDW